MAPSSATAFASLRQPRARLRAIGPAARRARPRSPARRPAARLRPRDASSPRPALAPVLAVLQREHAGPRDPSHRAPRRRLGAGPDRAGRAEPPGRAHFAQHSWAEGCGWADVGHAGSAPVVYVANGSHALYPRPGTADRPFPDPNDEADGHGRVSRPPVRRIDADSPSWMTWPGRWGASEAGPVPGEQSSPRGPAFQGERWDDPAAFQRDARPCGAGPPGRPWQTILTAVLAAGVLAAGATVLLRRRA
jgi:hypothetical protein